MAPNDLCANAPTGQKRHDVLTEVFSTGDKVVEYAHDALEAIN
jgi:hypothetical protein